MMRRFLAWLKAQIVVDVPDDSAVEQERVFDALKDARIRDEVNRAESSRAQRRLRLGDM